MAPTIATEDNPSDEAHAFSSSVVRPVPQRRACLRLSNRNAKRLQHASTDDGSAATSNDTFQRLLLSRAMTRKRLAILTGGGDCPGLNAVIRAAVRTATPRLRLRRSRHPARLRRTPDGLDHTAHRGVDPRHPAEGRHAAAHHESRQSVRVSRRGGRLRGPLRGRSRHDREAGHRRGHRHRRRRHAEDRAAPLRHGDPDGRRCRRRSTTTSPRPTTRSAS